LREPASPRLTEFILFRTGRDAGSVSVTALVPTETRRAHGRAPLQTGWKPVRSSESFLYRKGVTSPFPARKTCGESSSRLMMDDG
jgi:hypothetical protein